MITYLLFQETVIVCIVAVYPVLFAFCLPNVIILNNMLSLPRKGPCMEIEEETKERFQNG